MFSTDEILERGRSAARILADEDLMNVFADLERDIKAASFNKHSTDSAERESVFYQLKSISDILNSLRSRVVEAEHVLEALNSQDNTFDD